MLRATLGACAVQLLACVILTAAVVDFGLTEQCPEKWEHTCLPTSMPILQELDASTAEVCCAACLNNTKCVSWTLNTHQKKCHIRGSFLGKQHGNECTSGQIPGRSPVPSPSPGPSPVPPPADAKNVLLIVVDDLRPQLNCYNISVCGGRNMHTPNIDALAAKSLTFRFAFNQYSVCAPSRNSFMSGRRPDSTLAYNFKDDFRHAPGGQSWVSMPQYFKEHGYNSSGAGKTYHSGLPHNFDYPRSWSIPYPSYNQGLGFCGDHCACNFTDDKYRSDEEYANITIETLKSHKANNVGTD